MPLISSHLSPLCKYLLRGGLSNIQRTFSFTCSYHLHTGRTAIVTGASSGIGRAVALRLAKDGFNLSLNALHFKMEDLKDVERDIVGMGRRCLVTCGDVSSDDDVKALVESTVDQLNGIDVMVANAGISGEIGTIVDTPIEKVDKVYAVNIRGVHLCYKYAAQQMIKQGRGGRIIGASSLAGKQGLPNMSGYVASKFAVRGLTQAVGAELGKYGITVNAYAPGVIDTPLLQANKDTLGSHPNWFVENPVGRMGNPEEIASLVSFLVSPDAGFITGQSISINGGLYFD